MPTRQHERVGPARRLGARRELSHAPLVGFDEPERVLDRRLELGVLAYIWECMHLVGGGRWREIAASSWASLPIYGSACT